jgi:hypothetical protein
MYLPKIDSLCLVAIAALLPAAIAPNNIIKQKRNIEQTAILKHLVRVAR